MNRNTLLAGVALAVLVARLPPPARAAELSQAALFAYNPSSDARLRTLGVEKRGAATVVDLVFDGGSGADVKAYLVVPDGPGPFAGVLWVHWLGEPATSNRTQYLPEALTLAPKGIASLLVDAMWSAPEWYGKRVPEEDFDNSRRQVIALRRALDVLQSQSAVDKTRLGVVGHDYGGMYAMLMAGADPRAKTYVYVATAPSLSHWAFFANQPPSKTEYLRQNAVLELSDALRQVKNASTLFQFGTRDAYVSRADTAVLLGAASAPKERKLYDAEHDMSKPPEIAADRAAWLLKELVPQGGGGGSVDHLLEELVALERSALDRWIRPFNLVNYGKLPDAPERVLARWKQTGP